MDEHHFHHSIVISRNVEINFTDTSKHPNDHKRYIVMIDLAFTSTEDFHCVGKALYGKEETHRSRDGNPEARDRGVGSLLSA